MICDEAQFISVMDTSPQSAAREGLATVSMAMMSFIDPYRSDYGVEPICQHLPIAPSTYYEPEARQANPTRVPARVKRDRALCEEIRRVWQEHYRVYGARKVWQQLKREGHVVARCTVERLMRQLGIQGIRRGTKRSTTVRDETLPQPTDWVRREFTATRPNPLWVADITFVATRTGFVYTAFVVDVFARRIVGWRRRVFWHPWVGLGILMTMPWQKGVLGFTQMPEDLKDLTLVQIETARKIGGLQTKMLLDAPREIEKFHFAPLQVALCLLYAAIEKYNELILLETRYRSEKFDTCIHENRQFVKQLHSLRHSLLHSRYDNVSNQSIFINSFNGSDNKHYVETLIDVAKAYHEYVKTLRAIVSQESKLQ